MFENLTTKCLPLFLSPPCASALTPPCVGSCRRVVVNFSVSHRGIKKQVVGKFYFKITHVRFCWEVSLWTLIMFSILIYCNIKSLLYLLPLKLQTRVSIVPSLWRTRSFLTRLWEINHYRGSSTRTALSHRESYFVVKVLWMTVNWYFRHGPELKSPYYCVIKFPRPKSNII